MTLPAVSEPSEQPEGLLEEHLVYLDQLREAAAVNMFGAAPYLNADYPTLTEEQAKAIVVYWMETFGERHKRD